MKIPDPAEFHQPPMYTGDDRPPIIEGEPLKARPIRAKLGALRATKPTGTKLPSVRLPKTTRITTVQDAEGNLVEHTIQPANRLNIGVALGALAVVAIAVPAAIGTIGGSFRAQERFNQAQGQAFRSHDKALRGITVILGGEGVVGCSLPDDTDGCEVFESVAPGRAVVLVQPLTHKGLNTVAAAKPGWKPGRYESERTREDVSIYYDLSELKQITTVQNYSMKHPLTVPDGVLEQHPETAVGLSVELARADLPNYLHHIGAVPVAK